MKLLIRVIAAAATFVATTHVNAQSVPAASEKPPAAIAPAGAPAPLVVYFDSGSSSLRARDKTVLDKASRAYNDGKPIVMILTGTSDRVGKPEMNLSLSQRRATTVLKGLLDRGIPADRFQVLAKGESELPVPAKLGTPEAQDRRVEISWH